MLCTLTHLKDEYIVPAEDLMLDFPEVFSTEDRKQWRETLLKSLLHELVNTQVYVCLNEEKKVVGAISFHEDDQSQNHYWEIDWLVVRKDLHHQGVGSQLVQKAFEEIKARGGTHVFLHTSGAYYNQDTKHFYKKMKFRTLAILPDYYANKEKHANEDGVLFYRHLA